MSRILPSRRWTVFFLFFIRWWSSSVWCLMENSGGDRNWTMMEYSSMNRTIKMGLSTWSLEFEAPQASLDMTWSCSVPKSHSYFNVTVYIPRINLQHSKPLMVIRTPKLMCDGQMAMSTHPTSFSFYHKQQFFNVGKLILVTIFYPSIILSTLIKFIMLFRCTRMFPVYNLCFIWSRSWPSAVKLVMGSPRRGRREQVNLHYTDVF